MKARVFIIDTASPRCYDADSLLDEGSGGTIAAVIGLQRSLSAYFDVHVVLRQEHGDAGFIGPGRYEHMLREEGGTAAIVHVRSEPGMLDMRALRARSPGVPIIHWQHITLWEHPALSSLLRRKHRDYNRRLRDLLHTCRDNDITIVGTSSFHETNIRRVMQRFVRDDALDVGWTYNPVLVPELFEASASYDPDLMLFASNPKRGLRRALRQFEAIRANWPDMRLMIAAPAYALPAAGRQVPGVELVGSLTRRQLWELMDRAFALFYPNLEEPECFGYVFAEANALGCPVITHDIGAAAEVLMDERQLVDCTSVEQVLARVERWRNGARPAVRINDAVRAGAVAGRWYARITGKAVA